MASTKFYLDMRGRASDGKGTVLIQIFHNHSMTSVSTKIRTSPEEWDGKRIKSSGSEALNASLQEQKGKIDRAIALLSLDDSFQYMSAAEIKSAITERKPARKEHLISDLFYECMTSSNLKSGTKTIYNLTLNKIRSFSGDNCCIEQINHKWLCDFNRFLSKTQGINGRSIYLRSLRAVCNYAKKTGVQYNYPFSQFKIKQEPTKNRCITVEQLRELKDYPVDEVSSMYRDYFFLMFYLIGINSVDLLKAKKSQVINGRLEYIRAKTGKKYSIKIEPEAKEIIDKYYGNGDYLLDALDHCKHYVSFSHQMNDALKAIGPTVTEEIPDMEDLFGEAQVVQKVKPLIPGISTYYARHTWATIAYELGISIDTISQALGHSMGNKTTLIYIKPDQRKVDEANRKVIDHLLQTNLS